MSIETRQAAQTRNTPRRKEYNLTLTEAERQEFAQILKERIEQIKAKAANGELPYGLAEALLLLDKVEEL